MKNPIPLIAALGLLAACAANPDLVASIELPTCDKLAIPAKCENNPGSGPNAPTVNFNKNSLFLAPRNVCTNKGATLKFKITPDAVGINPPGSVAVIAKKGTDTWLIGTNSPDNKVLEIDIPAYLASNTDYEYTIVSIREGVVSCVDPRVHVQ